MPGPTSSTAQIYLSKQDGELVLCQGINPNRYKHADQRVLIVGGGVTGLTVSLLRDYSSCVYSNNRRMHGPSLMLGIR
jgi:hypothetical protein